MHLISVSLGFQCVLYHSLKLMNFVSCSVRYKHKRCSGIFNIPKIDCGEIFYRNNSKVQWFCKFRWLHRKNPIIIYQTATSFYHEIRFKVNKLANASIDKLSKGINLFFISLFFYIFIFTRSSKRIFKIWIYKRRTF